MRVCFPHRITTMTSTTTTIGRACRSTVMYRRTTQLALLLSILTGSSVLSSSLAAPVQLVAPDDTHEGLKVIEENLEVLRKIPGPIAVLSVVGSIHTGKSFFLNQLMGQGSGFTVGYSVKPQTAGIWLWSEPLLADGGVHVLLIDSEGFNAPNVTEEYDAKIFAIATLLSSELLFNTVKFIDNQALEYLELLTRRANVFGLRAFAAHNDDNNNNVKKQDQNTNVLSAAAVGGNGTVAAQQQIGELIEHLLPQGLSWIVQDFVQDLQGARPLDWLLSLIDAPRAAAPSDPSGQPAASSSIRSFFKSVDCLTLPHPTTQSQYLQKLDTAPTDRFDPEYLAAIKSYRQRLFNRLSANPKIRMQNGAAEPITGRDLAELLKFLVGAANVKSDSSAFPRMASVWERFAELQLQLTQNDLLGVFRFDASAALEVDGRHHAHRRVGPPNVPLSEDEVEKTLSEIRDRVLALWQMNVHGLENTATADAVEEELHRGLSDASVELRRTACTRLANFCKLTCEEVAQEVEMEVTEQQAAIPHAPESLTHYIRVNFVRAKGDLEQRLDAHGSYEIRTGKCCAPVVEDCLAGFGAMYAELTAVNDKAVGQSLMAAFEEAKHSMAASLGLPLASGTAISAPPAPLQDGRKMTEMEFKGYLERLSDESLRLYRLSAGRLISTHQAEVLENALAAELRKFEAAANVRWIQNCRQSSSEVTSSNARRMPIALRRRLPFPTTDESLSAAIDEQISAAMDELDDLACRGSSPWNEAKERLMAVLKEEGKKLDKQNVQAVKDLSVQPLSVVKTQLQIIAERHYLWFTFKRLSEAQALSALRRASEDQGAALSSALERKVVEAFISDDLMSQFRAVSFNLFRSVTLVFCGGLTVICFISRSLEKNFRWIAATGIFLSALVWDNPIREIVLKLLSVVFSITYSACHSAVSSGQQPRASVGLSWLLTLTVLHAINGLVVLTVLGYGLNRRWAVGERKKGSGASHSAGLVGAAGGPLSSSRSSVAFQPFASSGYSSSSSQQTSGARSRASYPAQPYSSSGPSAGFYQRSSNSRVGTRSSLN